MSQTAIAATRTLIRAGDRLIRLWRHEWQRRTGVEPGGDEMVGLRRAGGAARAAELEMKVVQVAGAIAHGAAAGERAQHVGTAALGTHPRLRGEAGSGFRGHPILGGATGRGGRGGAAGLGIGDAPRRQGRGEGGEGGRHGGGAGQQA